MEFSPLRARKELEELKKILKEKEGKTLTKKVAGIAHTKIMELDHLLQNAEENTLYKMLTRLRAVSDNEWFFQLPYGEELRINGNGLITLLPEAANAVVIKTEEKIAKEG